tara:strand:- start:1321 stop:2049 length:729 start_codon:yes stop_codon:yes gene_type:complete
MVSINTVYQRVLALANKEQRGYITPQEFNLYANQAQLELINQYFYDVNQFGRTSGNDTEYSDMLEFLHEKINMLTVTGVALTATAGNNFHLIPQDCYKLGTVSITSRGTLKEVEPVNLNELINMQRSPLTSPSIENPVYITSIRTVANVDRKSIEISPFSASGVEISYVRIPNQANWAYVVVGGKALYNMNDSTDFDLHESEESNLVYRILALAGITLADTGVNVYQASTAEEQKKVAQQKR